MTIKFKTHYETLARIAARLEEGDADIDEVLPLLEEAKAAYAACQERLEAVRRALGDAPAEVPDSDELEV
ncbi:exodeoxyribonuclease VII small subunit [Deinococcus peraridilitoris]|uniref:Exodeoxyribonuclease VII small subunit n=1 Tax=Deinococcus peraridilitoris (strain DSM 19664 / LMG 22246 / CIP 109416 / KR-200) TaxID=937777 RepID=L0A1R2_DEIPD|nr:Exonuclease VII small subunit [Deinococcus peraridilitoris DSM 19664]